MTLTVKDNVLAVFDMIGGREFMAEWAKQNPSDYFRLFNVHKDSDKDAPGGEANPVRTETTYRIVFPQWPPSSKTK